MSGGGGTINDDGALCDTLELGADAGGCISWWWLVRWNSVLERGVLERYGFAGDGDEAKYIKRSAPSSSWPSPLVLGLV